MIRDASKAIELYLKNPSVTSPTGGREQRDGTYRDVIKDSRTALKPKAQPTPNYRVAIDRYTSD